MTGLPPITVGEIALAEPFLALPGLGINDILAPFSLIGWAYEQEIAQRNAGLDLSAISPTNYIDPDTFEHYASLLLDCNAWDWDSPLTGIVELVESLERTEPHAAEIDSPQTLQQYMLLAHQISYAHYVVGRLMDSEFPKMFCGRSTFNVMLALWKHKLTQAIYASSEYDHGYVILPFVATYTDKPTEGCILVDPTSDQLWNYIGMPNQQEIENKPRNHVSVHLGRTWEYRANWYNGKNLSPHSILDVKKLREQIEDLTREGQDITHKNWKKMYPWLPAKEFFEQAFSNPAVLDIPYITPMQ